MCLAVFVPISGAVSASGSQPYIVSSSVVSPSHPSWSHREPSHQLGPNLWVTTTISLTMRRGPNGDPTLSIIGGGGGGGGDPTYTYDSNEVVLFTNGDGTTVYMTVDAVLEVNVNNGVITGDGICDSYNGVCSTASVGNGYAQCSGPTTNLEPSGGTIAYVQETEGGAAGIFLDHGIAGYPEVQYNANLNTWSYANPDFSSWTFAGVQCSAWSFSFPSP